MKILSCHVENFGKLHDCDCEWTDGFNVVRQSNGWGKSTLMAFIKCMFYGLANDGKRSIESERKRFDPWQGGTFGGRLCFECEGKEYEIVRTFGKKASEDTITIYDCVTKLPTDDFKITANGMGGSLGRLLFGIDEDSFSRSAFIAQGDVLGSVTSDINAKISNLADNTNDMGNYELAMETFKSALLALSENRATGKINIAKSEATKIRGEILQEAAAIESMKQLAEMTASAQAAINDLTAENGRLSEDMDRITGWQDDQIKREKYRLYDKACCEALANYEDAEREEKRLQKADTDGYKKSGLGIIGIALLGVGLIFIAVSLVSESIPDNILPVIGLIFAVIGAAFAVIGIMANRKAQKAYDENHDAYVAAKAKRDTAAGAYDKAKRELEIYTEKYGTAFLVSDGKGFEDGSGREFASSAAIGEKIQENLKEIHRLRGVIAKYNEQTEAKQEQLDELSGKKEQLAELEESIDEGRVKVRRLELARDLMEKAKNNMTAKYIDPLNTRFAHYYETLTGTSAADYMLDADNNISVDNAGERRKTETLSTGLKDAVGFCLRLALIDSMYKDEKPPIILDDAFANMDDANTTGALTVLYEVAQKYQVIYFTCHGK